MDRLEVVPAGAAFLVGDGVLLGVADAVADAVGDGVSDGVAVAVAVAEGVEVGVAVVVPDGVADGVAVAVADGDGSAEETDGDALGAGDALAGAMKATVEAVLIRPGWTLAYAPAAPAGKPTAAAVPATDVHTIAAAAPAAMDPSTVRVLRFAPRAWPLSAPRRSSAASRLSGCAAPSDRAGIASLSAPADIRPPASTTRTYNASNR